MYEKKKYQRTFSTIQNKKIKSNLEINVAQCHECLKKGPYLLKSIPTKHPHAVRPKYPYSFYVSVCVNAFSVESGEATRRNFVKAGSAAAGLALLTPSEAKATTMVPPLKAPNLTTGQVIEAQKAWGNGIVAISDAYNKGGDYVGIAEDMIGKLYAYGYAPVLFKPTLAADRQFRSSYDAALSYFVASNGFVKEDHGFAIQGWTNVRFENVDILTEGRLGLAMGNYYFTKPDGKEKKVEYTFAYLLDDYGNVRINLHHSSLPYTPPAPTPAATA